MTKIYSLVFDYDIAKMQASGRHWADEAYKNKEYIFEYSAASVATFLDRNPRLPYTVYTDDVALFADKIDAYRVQTATLSIVDHAAVIREWTSDPYCFWPLIKIADQHYDGAEDVMKLDNDLTCLKPIDELLAHRGAVVWKYERHCSRGRDYWGESYAARKGLGTDDFPIYNTGVLGLTKEHQHRARRIAEHCRKLVGVDISPVHRFPDKPGVVAKTYNTSDQVAVCYYLHEADVPVYEAHEFIIHHCYNKSKDGVLRGAEHLLRRI